MAVTAVEPYGTALFLLVVGVLIALSVLFSRRIDRLGVPIVLLFLVLGMLGGSEGIGGVAFDDFGVAVRVGTIYLVLILFDGGMNTPWGAVRRVAVPAGILATVGVALTAGTAGVVRSDAWPWLDRIVAARGPSFPRPMRRPCWQSCVEVASIFSRALAVRWEVESCANDPMAMILTVIMIEVAKSPDALRWTLALGVPLQLAIGAGIGVLIGYLGMRLIRRIRPPTVGLYPALTLAIAFVSFGAATLLEGSGPAERVRHCLGHGQFTPPVSQRACARPRIAGVAEPNCPVSDAGSAGLPFALAERGWRRVGVRPLLGAGGPACLRPTLSGGTSPPGKRGRLHCVDWLAGSGAHHPGSISGPGTGSGCRARFQHRLLHCGHEHHSARRDDSRGDSLASACGP